MKSSRDTIRVGNLCNPSGKDNFSFEWIIKDFLSLPKRVAQCYSSPLFAFHNALWCCKIFPNGKYSTPGNSQGCVSASLQIERSLVPQQYDGTISISIYSGDTKHEIASQQAVFNKNKMTWLFLNVLHQSNLINEKIEQKGLKIAFEVELTESAIVDVSKFNLLKDPMRCHPETLSRDLKDVFLNQKYCDVTIKVNGEQFRAHKAILGARSEVFAAMFEHQMVENLSDEVNITDADPDVFYNILLYIYSGEVQNMSMNSENVCQYFKLADKYDLQNLKFGCQELMECSMSESNIYEILILADVYNEINLKQSAIRFIVDKAEGIFQTNQWKKFRDEYQNLAFEILESGILKR